MFRTSLVAAIAAALLLLPHAAAAQSEAYVTVSLSTTQVYDTNVFATPSSLGPERDLSSRLGPTVETGFTSVPLRFVGRYGLEAERYLNFVKAHGHEIAGPPAGPPPLAGDLVLWRFGRCFSHGAIVVGCFGWHRLSSGCCRTGFRPAGIDPPAGQACDALVCRATQP